MGLNRNCFCLFLLGLTPYGTIAFGSFLKSLL